MSMCPLHTSPWWPHRHPKFITAKLVILRPNPALPRVPQLEKTPARVAAERNLNVLEGSFPPSATSRQPAVLLSHCHHGPRVCPLLPTPPAQPRQATAPQKHQHLLRNGCGLTGSLPNAHAGLRGRPQSPLPPLPLPLRPHRGTRHRAHPVCPFATAQGGQNGFHKRDKKRLLREQ